tara:strand:- start:331 stop:1161 length:831 start_codon:yes stop_codon:yes gene_type:complete
MTELEDLMVSVKDKTENTKKTYTSQYNKLFKLTGKDIGETSEKKLLEIVLNAPNQNQQQALLNIAILVRRRNKVGTTNLEKLREKNKGNLKTHVKEQNIGLAETLPTYQDLIDYTDYLYSNNDWIEYIINYLLINYQVRNADLVFDIVKLKKEAKDNEKNYIWLTNKKAVYIRNVYKTSGKYGKKTNTITEPKFIVALKRIMSCQKYNEACGTIIPTESQAGYYIKKYSYKQLGEGKIVKIVVNHFRNDLQMLKEISDSRGTSLTTLAESYDIKNL